MSCGIILYYFINNLKDDYLFKYIVPILPILCVTLSLFILSSKFKIKKDTDVDGKITIDNTISIIENSKLSFISN